MRFSFDYLLLLIISRIGGIGASIFAMKIIIERGGEAAWGEVVLLLSALNLLSIVTLLGQENYLLSMRSQDVHLSTARGAVNSVLIAIAIAIPLIAVLLWSGSDFVGLRPALVLLPAFTLYRVSMRYYQKTENRTLFSAMNGETLFYVVLLCVCALPLSPLWVEDWSSAVVAAVILFVISIATSLPMARSVPPTPLKIDRRQLLGGLPFLVGGSMLLMMGWLDTFLLGFFRGARETGQYNVIFRMASVATIFLSLTNAVIAPRLAGLHEEDPGRFEDLVRFSNRVNLLASTLLVGITVLAFQAIVEFLGVGSDVAADLRFPGYVLLAAYLVNSACGNVGYVLQMTGRARVFNRFVTQAAGLNVILNVALIPSLGILGAALATGISMVWWNVAAWVHIARNMGVRLV